MPSNPCGVKLAFSGGSSGQYPRSAASAAIPASPTSSGVHAFGGCWRTCCLILSATTPLKLVGDGLRGNWSSGPAEARESAGAQADWGPELRDRAAPLQPRAHSRRLCDLLAGPHYKGLRSDLSWAG